MRFRQKRQAIIKVLQAGRRPVRFLIHICEFKDLSFKRAGSHFHAILVLDECRKRFLARNMLIEHIHAVIARCAFQILCETEHQRFIRPKRIKLGRSGFLKCGKRRRAILLRNRFAHERFRRLLFLRLCRCLLSLLHMTAGLVLRFILFLAGCFLFGHIWFLHQFYPA